MIEIYSKEKIQQILLNLGNFVEFNYDRLLSSEKEEISKSIADISGEIEYFSEVEPDPDYRPYREIRRDIVGEVAMMKHWNRLMNTLPPYYDRMIDYILGTEEVSIRGARICSSVILWLGTNCGGALLHEAKRLKDNNVINPYSVQFHLDSMNYPYDPLDYIRRIVTFPHCPDPEINVKDLVTVHKLMLWLGSVDGEKFLSDVEEEIQIRVDATRRTKYVKNII
jgi:hypothetical protein